MAILTVIFLTLPLCGQVRLLADLGLSREPIKPTWLLWPESELHRAVTWDPDVITSDLQV